MDADAIHELFQSVQPISIRRMFGGKGIYSDGMIIALELRDEIMLKGDSVAGALYEDAGSRKWTYEHNKTGKTVAMPYWTMPDSAFDDPDDAAHWVRLARDAALRLEKAK